ncbi:MAG: hypothetical protein RBT75_20015 [Anaerolineae bacterium]|jgi:hypothetical protein|nr:hypothetical protein [Anaerolineae bacterium]
MTDETTATSASETAARPTTSSGEDTWRAVLDGTVNLLENLGEALVKSAQDLSQLMVIRVDEDTRDRLDMLVEAEVIKTRREGVSYLLEAGIKAKSDAFTRIAAARERITALRTQLREGVQDFRSA